MVIRTALLTMIMAIGCGQGHYDVGPVPQLPALKKPGDVGVVMNIDLTRPEVTKRHFEIAKGWAKFVRVSVGMDMEGEFPDAERNKFGRLRTLARECASRGLGMHVITGGVPNVLAEEWQKLGHVSGYKGKRYNEMPESWWPKYAAWQRRACQEIVEAYGPLAYRKVRFQLFNEPYDRGEDPAVTRLINFVIPRLTDEDGKIFGCELDGPSLWGNPDQMKKQIDMLHDLMERFPSTFGRIGRIPLNMYPPGRYYREADELTAFYIAGSKQMVDYARRALRGHEIYFSEFGVSRVWDSRPEVFGDQFDDVAAHSMLETLREMRKYVSEITIYQTLDTNIEVQKREGFGLQDASGNPMVNMDELRRIANKR